MVGVRVITSSLRACHLKIYAEVYAFSTKKMIMAIKLMNPAIWLTYAKVPIGCSSLKHRSPFPVAYASVGSPMGRVKSVSVSIGSLRVELPITPPYQGAIKRKRFVHLISKVT
jgi:hypothetical protein